MDSIFQLILLVFKRLRHNLGLSISALIGIVAILGIVVCVPVFSHAISSEVLLQELQTKVETSHRRLFSLHLYYLDSGATSNFTVENGEQISDYLKTRIHELLGVPVDSVTLEIHSGSVNLIDPIREPRLDPQVAPKAVRFIDNGLLPQYAKIVDGSWPQPDSSSSGPIQVAISEKLADEIFLNVGEQYQIEGATVEITGIWQPINPEDRFWYENTELGYPDKLWIPDETFRTRLKTFMRKPVFYVSWYVVVNEADIRFQRAPQYARGLIRLQGELVRILPTIKIDYSPMDPLVNFQQRAELLTTLSYAVGAPMIILALLFIGLTARISVQQYEQEILTMRGRGTSWRQVAMLNIVESLLLLIVAVPLSLVVGWYAASLMGNTISFLNFTERPPLPLSLDGVNNIWLLATVLLIIIARFTPTLGISRTTIVKLKQEQSRGSQKPLWQRFYLDFLLLLPGIYAFIVLRGWAKPATFLASLESSGEQYRDPLLFVAPALFAMAVCMIAIRLLPLLFRLISTIVERLPGAWAYLSLQQIARRPQDHASALLLVMISLSLSIYSASSAKTLDKWLHDSVYYNTGSDLSIHEYIVSGGNQGAFGPPSSGGGTLSELDFDSAGYINLEDHVKLPSVEAAARVSKYRGSYSYGVGESNCVIMGIDRYEFPQVAFYRDDFAGGISLGALMNELASEYYGVIIPTSMAEELGFQKGDHLLISFTVADTRVERDMIIVGTYDYFPTVYPARDPTIIVNLESLFDNPEEVVGYNIWLKLRPDADINYLTYQIRQLIGQDQAVVVILGNAVEDITKGQAEPERVGLFGILNVGFLTTGLMPGIGFVLYSYASLRRRFIQLGILQAIGLSVRQLVGYLVSEQILLMGTAILTGAGIGLLASNLFVPFLQVGAAPGAPIPPFEVLIGWTESLWLSLGFSVVLFLTTLGTIIYLARLKVFQAVKMGESL